MKERARELKAAKNKEEAERDVLAKIAEMPKRIGHWPNGSTRSSRPPRRPSRQEPGTGCLRTPTTTARSSASSRARNKFKSRYATFGFNQAANLDQGAMWPTSFALTELTPKEEAKIGALVKKAVR
jgi:hypothetical protein